MAYQFRLDDDLIHFQDPGDQVWFGANKAVFIPDADFGIYYTAKIIGQVFLWTNYLNRP